MIQINLVPDVKQEMLRMQRIRNIAISISIIAGLAAGGVVVALSLTIGAQMAVQKYQKSQIESQYQKLSDIKDLNNSLTIQNQLATISLQNDSRTMTSRILDILSAINPPAPNDVKISKVSLDPKEYTLTLEGSAIGGYPATDVFRKTILNAKVSFVENGSSETQEQPLTNDVILQNTSYGEDSAGTKVVRFVIIFNYPTGMLDNGMRDVKVTTPSAKVDVTDSKTRVPDTMFSQAPKDVTEEKK